MQYITYVLVLFALLGSLERVKALSSVPRNLPKKKGATICVCTGADCRVDGASACLKQLQQAVKKDNEGNVPIRVKARACLGPCGDGPCVVVLDGENQKVVQERPFQPPKSLAPPDLFGDSSRGVYQVRTRDDVEFVLQLAAQTAGLDNIQKEESLDENGSKEAMISSTRAWYDRPRNERKVLQRLMQFCIIVGLYERNKSQGEIDEIQWQVAGLLFVLSSIIMKENLLQQLWERIGKKVRSNM